MDSGLLRVRVSLVSYYSLDRPGVLDSAKECMRRMSQPSRASESSLKRIVRYLRTQPRMAAAYKWAELPGSLDVYVDADHAGCLRTRRSTIGGVVLWGGKLIKAWSKTMEALRVASFGLQAKGPCSGFPKTWRADGAVGGQAARQRSRRRSTPLP